MPIEPFSKQPVQLLILEPKVDQAEAVYKNTAPTWANAYLWPILLDILAKHPLSERRAFDLGCGNGATANMLFEHGYDVTGIDLSESGIALGRESFPHLKLDVGNVYDELAERYGQFPVVVSLEVIEHCFYPRRFARTFYHLLSDRGVGILSTPYHGYWKNLALAAVGKWDDHLTVLSEEGHIKFFSIRTLETLLAETGFSQIRFLRAGRIPTLAKSMIAVVRK
jgi:2-polyprenyl-6-hydroxyphenyl methylase/3-demethylubiquinone-9 3-methyltransferase